MVGDDRLERRTMPKTERIDRLHVVMSVEQYVRPRLTISTAVGFGDNGGMAGGRPDVGGKTERRDVPGKMIGGRLAIPGKGRVGPNRIYPQQAQQPLHPLLPIPIHALYNS